MKTIILILTNLAFMLLTGSLLAHNVIRGKVFDQKTNLPLAYANVSIKGTSNGTITDIEGKFEIATEREKVPWLSHILVLNRKK